MNFRRGRRRYRGRGSELCVKEIILPEQEQKNPGPSNSDRYKYQERSNTNANTPHTLKLGEHEINAFCGLTILEKPPLENYFQGTKKRKYKKRKPKLRNTNCLRDGSAFCDSFMPANEACQSRSEPVTSSNFFDKYDFKRKIFIYEKRLEEEQEKNYKRQRRLEKESMEQQENLAETWLGFFQRRQELKKKDLEENRHALPRWKYHTYYRPINISLLPKKFWTDGTDDKKPKPEKRREKQTEKSPKLPVVFEDLESEFTQKLVFVDDSDDSDSQRSQTFPL